ncbi:MAG TPA: hypothetical protein VJ600_00750 [Holophagaceae bacterium]|nr:hypothetical protein [Holophagaceae bacterium]
MRRSILLLPLLLTCGGGGSSGSASSAPPPAATCPPQGNATSSATQALNVLKNRNTAPAALNPAITFAALVAPGDDSSRWSGSDGAEITALVYDVLVGGVESANCDATDPALRDTHLELVADAAHTAPTQRVIVEVTPRWRTILAAQGVDWSTTGLQALKGRTVTVRGWMLYDWEHKTEAFNTAPANAGDWRATAWEIHPITALTVQPGPVAPGSSTWRGHEDPD